MRVKIIYLLLFSFIAISANSQINRSEYERETKKGSALLNNGKLEDAIEIFNDILKKDPTEGKALLLRARTKMELGAYKGAKNDCFTYMDIYGIDEDVAGLLGKIEMKQENFKQALAYLKTAIMFDPTGVEYLLDRAEIFYNLGLDEQACIDWHEAILNGSEEAQELSDEYCQRVRIPIDDIVKDKVEEQEPNKSEEPSDEMGDDSDPTDNDSMSGNDSNTEEEENLPASEDEDYTQNENTDDDMNTSDEEVIDEVDAYPIDDKIEEIYIDEDLTIIIADGIGSRKVTEIPDILILSDNSGEVVVNVCIDRLGRVQSPTLNEEMSTIKTKSLISLALRESSNFRFARSSRKNHCGTITFVITGS